MLDWNNTSPEWEEHGGDIVVLPIGAMEQHAAHMPLKVDSFHAEYFGKAVAERFDAALLPTIPIGNSIEHSGFRGSFSLRPETLIQIVRDLADDAEAQGFRIMVVVNGHGANFVLSSVCRDINRRDRKIKIILVSAWGMAPGGVTTAQKERKTEVHSGENETSCLLGTAPELVRERRPAPEPEPWDPPWMQSDLTTFGVKRYSPNGNLGDYMLATAEKGRQLKEGALKNLMRYLEDRIARLRQNPKYAG